MTQSSGTSPAPSAESAPGPSRDVMGVPVVPELPPLVGDAAAVVLLRDGTDGPQVLLLERVPTSRSFAGAWVFPGGFVDPEDFADGDAPAAEIAALREAARARSVPDLRTAALSPAVPAAARRAAVRETLEETGLSLAPDALVPTATWVPRRSQARRMRAWYFLARWEAGERGTEHDGVVLNPDEHVAAQWLSPGEALRRHGAGELVLVPPLWLTLHLLAQFPDAASALAGLAADPPTAYRSQSLEDGGRRYVVWEGDPAWVDEHAEPADGAGVTGAEEATVATPGAGATGQPAGEAGPAADARFRLDVTALPWTLERRGV